MDFLAIGDVKIKIVMSREERERYGISQRDDGCVSTSRRAVWDILDCAKRESGFDPHGDKILVQFYPLSDGGCELFVTKLGILGQGSAKLVSRSDRVTLLGRQMRHYLFAGRDAAACAARIICASRTPPRTSSLFSSGDTYVLSLEEETSGAWGEYTALSEFGTLISEETFSYVREHYDKICESGAVELLASE